MNPPALGISLEGRIFQGVRCEMGVMKNLLEEIEKAETLEEITPLVNALAAGAMAIEAENVELKSRIKELESSG